MSGFAFFSRSNAATRLRKFRLVYDTTCSILDALGIPFRSDQDCSVLYDDTDPRELVGNSISYHFNGEIVICRRHLQEPLRQCQVTLVHEITHYWCEVFPEVMRKQHLFRVPRPQPLPVDLEVQNGARDLVSRYHHLAYDSDNEHFLGSYSQVSSDECLAEFMAHLVVHDPDLRTIASPRARRRFRACRRMLDGLRRAYATYDQVG